MNGFELRWGEICKSGSGPGLDAKIIDEKCQTPNAMALKFLKMPNAKRHAMASYRIEEICIIFIHETHFTPINSRESFKPKGNTHEFLKKLPENSIFGRKMDNHIQYN